MRNRAAVHGTPLQRIPAQPSCTRSRYEEIAEETFGKLGRLIISSIIYVELFGTCCLLFILEVR